MEQRRLSQGALARLIHYSRAHVSNVLAGKQPGINFVAGCEQVFDAGGALRAAAAAERTQRTRCRPPRERPA
jgi:transcriptional regulator with XRE-family HTH domain